MTKRKNSFEETKRVSNTKGFLGYKDKNYEWNVRYINYYYKNLPKDINPLINIILAKNKKEVKRILTVI